MSNTHLRGFASMPREKQREIASKGGSTAHKLGRAHRWDSKTAREAGAKGREIAARNRANLVRVNLATMQFHVQ